MEPLRAGPLWIPPDDLELKFSRSSGPGGQNVNKRDTRVEVTLNIDSTAALSDRQRNLVRARLGARIDGAGRLRVVSGAARTQAENRRRALDRLAAILEDALRAPPTPRRPTRPSKAAVRRRVEAKKARGELKRGRRAPLEE